MKEKIREILEDCGDSNGNIKFNKWNNLANQLHELFEVNKAKIYEKQGQRIQKLAQQVMRQREEIAELKAQLKEE